MGNCTGICGKDMVAQTIEDKKQKLDMEEQQQLEIALAVEDVPQDDA